MSPDPRQRRFGIIVPILLLVLGAVVTAASVNFLITFSGPPPMPAPYRIEDIASLLARAPGADTGPPGRRIELTVEARAPTPREGERPDGLRSAAIAARLGRAADQVRGYFAAPQRMAPPGMGREVRGGFTVAVADGDHWRVARTRPEPLITSWHRTALLGMLIVLLVLALPAWLIARRLSRPLVRLADAADAFQVGDPHIVIPVGGSHEVARLGEALNAMRDRLLGHVEARTHMLAAIAHDLGTPLTRLAFWIDKLPDAERARAAQDLDEMRRMIADVLDYAQHKDAAGDHGRLELGSLVESLAEDLATTGRDVTAAPAPRAIVTGDARTLRRLFANLIENGCRYGERTRIATAIDGGHVTVTIEDDGPGFDPSLGARLLDPFVRGEPSRNRATGGAGLGLAIARGIVEGHAGTLEIGNRSEGGGVATVRLPLATD